MCNNSYKIFVLSLRYFIFDFKSFPANNVLFVTPNSEMVWKWHIIAVSPTWLNNASIHPKWKHTTPMLPARFKHPRSCEAHYRGTNDLTAYNRYPLIICRYNILPILLNVIALGENSHLFQSPVVFRERTVVDTKTQCWVYVEITLFI